MAAVLERMEEGRQQLCFGVMMAVAHQICEGMEAVAAEGLIHRNLAIRNVLCFALDPADPALTDVKVCDFGLTKSGQTFYGGEAAAPVRWMPPESLKERRWSEQSDVSDGGAVPGHVFALAMVPVPVPVPVLCYGVAGGVCWGGAGAVGIYCCTVFGAVS